MTSLTPLRAVVTAGALVLALGACGSDGAKKDTAAPAAGASSDQIEVKDFAFKPEAATVKVGTKVTWTFKDDAAHSVVPESGATEPMKSPDLKSGGTYSFTFTKPGLVKYRCGIHNYMTGTVMVTA